MADLAISDLAIADIVVEYVTGNYTVRPVDGLSLRASAGSLVLLLGPSGCGKTTLLSCLAGILRPTSGSVTFDGDEVTSLSGKALTQYRRRRVGIVFQAFNLVPSLTAVENVAIPMGAAGVKHREAKARATALLTELDLGHRLHHRPGDLSGGQQQRVAIARALALDPPLVLADEPTAHLDYVQVEGILRIIRRLTDNGRVVVVATHDERLLPLADMVVELAPRGESGLQRAPEAVVLVAGQELFHQGTRGELIYVIDEGEVDVIREEADGTQVLLATLPAGDHVGEMGPLFGLPRSATARARTDARLTAYTATAFREQLGVERLSEVIRGRDPA